MAGAPSAVVREAAPPGSIWPDPAEAPPTGGRAEVRLPLGPVAATIALPDAADIRSRQAGQITTRPAAGTLEDHVSAVSVCVPAIRRCWRSCSGRSGILAARGHRAGGSEVAVGQQERESWM